MTPVRGRSDLHLHSSESDGSLGPSALVDAAAQAGLDYISLCDHDSVGALRLAQRRARNHPVCVITGVELGVQADPAGGEGDSYRLAPGELHLLGYGMQEMRELEELLADMRLSRERRIMRILDRLSDAGVELGERDVRQQMQGSRVPGRPHVARALVARGYCRSEKEAFSQHLVPGRPGYVPRKRLSLREGVRVVTRAAGVPVFAHPGLGGRVHPNLSDAVRMGVQGIEVIHPDHSLAMMARLIRLARQHDLVPTGGSDYHGRPTDPALGEVTAPTAWVQQLLALM